MKNNFKTNQNNKEVKQVFINPTTKNNLLNPNKNNHRMRNLIVILLVALAASANAQGQAFEKGCQLNSIGFGVSKVFHIIPGDHRYYGYYGAYGYNSAAYTTLTGEFNIQVEKAVSDYVGVGANFGFGGHATRLYGYGEANFLIGIITNFHFYQLIADKTGKDIHADKLDIYAGINVGTGVAGQFGNFGNDNARLAVLAWGGFQVGARYYVSQRVAVNLEAGYGKSLINGGITIKVGKK